MKVELPKAITTNLLVEPKVKEKVKVQNRERTQLLLRSRTQHPNRNLRPKKKEYPSACAVENTTFWQ